MNYVKAYVVDNIHVYRDVYHLILRTEIERLLPGHFIMIWIPEVEEVPMAPSLYRDGIMRITYKVVGETTGYMSRLDRGEKIYIRGPLGKPYKLNGYGRYLLIGGGVGVAPLIYSAHILSERGVEFTYVEGVPNSNYEMFIDEAISLGGEALLYTEDGSKGVKGYPTEYLKTNYRYYDYILACGPDEFNRAVYRLCREYGLNCQISFERIVKCGVGVCGSCVLEGTGLLVCLDGPVFNISTLYEYGYSP
ncbi:TPA: dihydroorotate dehydrogenase electron transfer subunit [Candidatus Geothermarchaeota archaeon]|nr:dihydroorotate dehydrogenase electron transfer subunit [Candidatus Geothermarchaeota archaeon]HIQ12975.1 dihydroorotate dehydrogenase electron transfer subunit [Thermoprotei archaeon]